VTTGFAPVAGWIALSLIPATALIGWALRRFASGRFAARMRPHAIAGYAALALTLVHLAGSMGGMGGANTTGIWLATLGIVGLTIQVLLGSNLQSPGGYRLELHRWHVAVFVVVLLLAVGHVALNASVATMFTKSATNPQWDHRRVSSPVATLDLLVTRSFLK
jgi:hypothetical protein